MNYYSIIIVHLSTVAFNIGFFTLRFYWMVNGSRLGKQAWTRYLSQFNDTLLLLAGISLATMSQQYPLVHHWLTAKLIGLVIYIVAGTLALKRAKRKSLRIFFGLVAFAALGYILSVALTRNAFSWEFLG